MNDEWGATDPAGGEALSPVVDNIWTWRKRLVRRMLRILIFVGAPVLILVSYFTYGLSDAWTLYFYAGTFVILLVVTFWPGVSYHVQAWVFLGLIYGMGVLDLFDVGVGGDGRLFLLTVPIMAAFLLGKRPSVLTFVLSLVTLGGFAVAFSSGALTISPELEVNSANWLWWLTSIVIFFMMGTVLVTMHSYLVPQLVSALENSGELVQQLAQAHSALQARAEGLEAARELLVERAHALETTAEVARDAASVLDLQALLTRVVKLVSQRFGFYHTGIFLVDSTGEWAVLRAASSPGGQHMLARGHRLRVGAEGIVGYVTGYGEPRIALDVGRDAVHFDNPDLPETRSEMALSLRARGEILGALDVQSVEPGAFSEDDIAVLQTLTDQVAMAISNVRLFRQAQESLAARQLAYGELTREGWVNLLQTQPDLRERYDPQGILPSEDAARGGWRREMRLAVRRGEIVPGKRGEMAALVIPIKVRDQVVGVLDAYKPQGAGEWSPEELKVVETLSDQLGVALESARLYQEAQRRAAREQLTGEISNKLQQARDMDGLIRQAAQELQTALGASYAVVHMGTEDELLDEFSK